MEYERRLREERSVSTKFNALLRRLKQNPIKLEDLEVASYIV